MPCQELVEVVTDYFEGALAARDRARFEAHLAECEACRDYIEQMRHTIALAGRLRSESLPSGARDELLRVFRGRHAS